MSGAPQDYTQRCVGIERVSHEVNRIIAGERLAQYGWRGGADFPTRWKTPMPCLPPSNQPGLIARGAVFFRISIVQCLADYLLSVCSHGLWLREPCRALDRSEEHTSELQSQSN